MKKFTVLILIIAVISGTSCKRFLDINKNPNEATYGTPFVMLPQAITYSASVLNNYNSYGAQMGLYMANAGGFGGFGSNVTYNFTSSDYQGLWNNAYDVLEDYQQVLEQTAGNASLRYYNSIARIMKAHAFQLLVDNYNSVPYYESLGGLKKLTPKYDDPVVIYKDLGSEVDKAIDTINLAEAASIAPREVSASEDPMFSGDMTMWKKFANTLKLRMMLTSNGKVAFAKTTFDPAGFLETDALVNPGYTRTAGKQNPKWQSWAFFMNPDSKGSATKAWMPSTYVMEYYKGGKLLDYGRGYAIYYQYASTPTNRLGFEGTSVVSSPDGNFWYPSSSNRNVDGGGGATGVLKGPDAPMPVITAAESYFLQAEAVVRGMITSSTTAQQLFDNGIEASFKYLYMRPNGTFTGDFADPVGDAELYHEDNEGNRLVDFSLNTSTAQKIEAIITQKFIALNMVNSDQAWNDYRRTHYPAIISTAGATGAQTFASSQSNSTRADKLPTRVMYPSTEGSYNTANVPRDISPFTSLIFWAMP